jgi:aminoglycoside phosphotransferase (APT) family kinase protein
VQPYEDVAVVAQYVRSIFPEEPVSAIERVAEGVSTCVYRIQCAGATYYLRILPEAGASLAPEADVHRRLRAAGVRVPDIVHYEACPAAFQRSAMMTTALPGCALGYGQQPAAGPQILRQAGRDLARINQVTVQGYGWVDRTAGQADALRAEYATLPQWLLGHFDAPIRALHQCCDFSAHDVGLLQALLEAACRLFQHEAAVLAHGDFDVTHIFYDRDTYSGVIDFGEIRGAHPLYDLGHFAIEHSDRLPHLIEGYSEITPLAANAIIRIQLTSLLIAARRIGGRLLQARQPHGPDIAFVLGMLPVCRGGVLMSRNS